MKEWVSDERKERAMEQLAEQIACLESDAAAVGIVAVAVVVAAAVV